MNISRKWLKEFVDITATDKEYDEIMTIAGQKVETTTRMDEDIKNVVVGKVLSMAKHENSDHMWVCQVDVGDGEPIQIVTGAQNVTVGDLVPVAKHNSYLPGGVHITKGKLRGVESCGMLCSFKELGLTVNDCPTAYEDGIWILNNEDVEIGEDMNKVIGNDDSIVEFEITNNRPDCYSLLGLARETAAAFNVPMHHHEPVVKGGAEGVLTDLLDVEVPADDLCLRYTARMVRNVKIAPSPKWMRQRLRSAGVRPINNIVDITNYVMIEYGQPMHAFDYRYVSGGKIIVTARAMIRRLRRWTATCAICSPTCSSSPTKRSPSVLPVSWAAKTAKLSPTRSTSSLNPRISRALPSARRHSRSACARTLRRNLKRTSTRCSPSPPSTARASWSSSSAQARSWTA